MNPTHLRWITNFGDSGVTLPLIFLLIALLWFAESRRAAWLLARALLACVGLIAVLKLSFLTCGHIIGLGIQSPSGHACLTAFVYGCIAVVVWAQPRPALRFMAVAAAAFIISFVAASRVVLGAHSVAEVVMGLAAGLAALALFAKPYIALRHPAIRLRQIGLVLGAAFIITYGTVLPAEGYVRSFVPWLQTGFCRA